MNTDVTAPEPPRAEPPAAAPPAERPGAPALVLLAAWLALFLLAPAAHNAFWAVNGLRSVTPTVALLLAFAAAGAAVLAWRAPREPWAPAVAALAIATVVAFPLREVLHLLGDTATRQGAMINFVRGTYAQPLSAWARQIHAQPVDLAMNLLLPVRLLQSTNSIATTVSIVSWLLAVPALACAWAIARRLDAGRDATWGLWLALVAWGGLQAYAGYAESAGLTLLTALAWWLAMLRPVATPRDAALLAGAWLLAAFSHRTALLLLAPSAWRLLGPPLPGDATPARRQALGLVALSAALVVLAGLRAGGGQLAADARELLQWPAPDTWRSLPTDLVNLALLSAPLAIAAPVLAGAEARRAFVRDPRAAWLLITAVLYVPLAFPLPVAGSGLGVHRDWDLSIVLGLTLTLAGAVLLSHLPAARLRGALIAALPVLVIGAGGWVAVNADLHASLRRIEALATGQPELGAVQRSSVYLFYGNRAMDQGDAPLAARLLKASWDLVPSPGRGTHTIIAWMYAGQPDSARRMVARMRARGGLDDRNRAALDTLEMQIRMLEGANGPE